VIEPNLFQMINKYNCFDPGLMLGSCTSKENLSGRVSMKEKQLSKANLSPTN